MNGVPTPRFSPERIANPVQLLAAVFLTMAVLVAAFLTAAGVIREPGWALLILIIAAVSCASGAVAVMVLMLTRFRHALLADEPYLRWLDMTRRRFRGFRPRVQGESLESEPEETRDARPQMREAQIERYKTNEGVFITYDWRPSRDPEQIADLVVRLQQHVSNEGQSGPLERGEIESVEYYLGPKFAGGRAVVRRNASDGFRLDVTAYSPVLCIAAVNIRGRPNPIYVEHYLAFGD